MLEYYISKKIKSFSQGRRMAPFILIAIFVTIGITAVFLEPKPDSPIEETAEHFTERQLEDMLDLPPGSMKGKVDYSPNSPEEN